MSIDHRINQSELSAVFDAQGVSDALFDALLRAAMQISGAQHGYVLMAKEDAFCLAAEGVMDDQNVNVLMHREDQLSEPALPTSILTYVQHHRTHVVLDDAAEINMFSADIYLTSRHAKSILCLPMTKQEDLVGLLYLESDLVAGAFTTERVTTLNLLVSQAMVSLENTQHCAHLLKENERLNVIVSELAFQRNLLRALGETFPHRIYAKDTETRFTFGNMAVAQGMGVSSPDELLGKTDFGFYPVECATQYYEEEQAIMQSGQPMMHHEEKVNYLLTNEVAWMLTTKMPLRDDDGKVIGIVGVNYNITERKEMELVELVSRNADLSALNIKLSQAQDQLKDANELLTKNETRYRLLVESSPDAIVLERDNCIVFANTSALQLFSAKNISELLGRSLLTLVAPDDQEHATTLVQDLIQNHVCCISEEEIVRLDGQSVAVAVTRVIFFDQGAASIQTLIRDISENKRLANMLQHQANHDGLTDLLNRTKFGQILNTTIQAACRYHRHFAVLFIDLDRFKNINDTLGHEAGDTLLKEISNRLTHCVRSCDVVARLGGDEFVVLLQEIDTPEQAAMAARKILSSIIQPVSLLGQTCRVTASIGIALYPKDGENEQALMKNADIAMYLAKEEGKNNYQFYSVDIRSHSLERLSLENGLVYALERNEFLLHYQAKQDIANKRITGVEALLRWQSADLGVISPQQFIPLAEETGLIVSIGKWVLRTACKQNVAWLKQGLPPMLMAINISPRQFVDDDFLFTLNEVLQETGMDPSLLELEITEGMVMQNSDRTVKQLFAIKKLGVRLAIDDFGTGYSSLAQLKRFPIDTLKVDRSFIRDIAGNAEVRAITEAIITMGKTLSLTVVAEGVETQEQQNFIQDHACDELQGFYFSKPIPAEQFAHFLEKHITDGSVFQIQPISGDTDKENLSD